MRGRGPGSCAARREVRVAHADAKSCVHGHGSPDFGVRHRGEYSDIQRHECRALAPVFRIQTRDDWKEQSKSLEATDAYYPFNVNLATRSEAEQVAAALRNGMGLTLVGVACGIAASLALTRLLAGLLLDIGATDPLAFSAAAFLLVITALLACSVPARKASRLDPINHSIAV